MSGADWTGGLGPFLRGCFPPPQGGLGGQPLAQNWGASRDGENSFLQCSAGGIWPSWLRGPQRRWPLRHVSPHGEASRSCAPQPQHLGFCPNLVPSASLQPFTSLVPVCHSWVAPCQLANPRCRTGRDRVNGFQQGCRRELVRVAGHLVTGQPEKEVSGHVHDGPGMIQLLELGSRVWSWSWAGASQRGQGDSLAGPTRLTRPLAVGKRKVCGGKGLLGRWGYGSAAAGFSWLMIYDGGWALSGLSCASGTARREM